MRKYEIEKNVTIDAVDIIDLINKNLYEIAKEFKFPSKLESAKIERIANNVSTLHLLGANHDKMKLEIIGVNDNLSGIIQFTNV